MAGRAAYCLLLLSALGAVAAGSVGRDSTVASAANISVPLSNKHNIAYTAHTKVGAGASFPLIFDTGSSDLWVPSADCSNCALDITYEKTSKGTEYPDQTFDIHYGSGSVSGYKVVDSVEIGGLRSEADVRFGAVTHEATQIVELFKQEEASGIFGLAFPALASTVDSGPTAYQQWCIDHGIQKVAAVYMTDPEGDSEMLLGAFDLSKVKVDEEGNRTIHYTPLLKRGGGEGQYAYWEVPVLMLTVTEGGPASMAQLAAHDRRLGKLPEAAVSEGVALDETVHAPRAGDTTWLNWAASIGQSWLPWAAAPALRRARRSPRAPPRSYPLPPGMERVVEPERGPPLSSVAPGAAEAKRSGLSLSDAVARGVGADGVARPVHLAGDNTIYSDCETDTVTCTAIVDTGTSYIGVPSSKWESLMGAVSGGRCSESGGEYVCQQCDLGPFPTINIGTSHQLFTLEPVDYVAVREDGSCILEFQRLSGTSMYILGSTFIRRYYSIFDMESNPARVGAGSSNYEPPSRNNPGNFWMTFFLVVLLSCGALCFCGIVYALVARASGRGASTYAVRQQYPLSARAVQEPSTGPFVQYGAQQAAPGTYATPPGTYAAPPAAPPGTYAAPPAAPPGTYAAPPAAPAGSYAQGPAAANPYAPHVVSTVPMQPAGTYSQPTAPPSTSPYTQHPVSGTYAVPPQRR